MTGSLPSFLLPSPSLASPNFIIIITAEFVVVGKSRDSPSFSRYLDESARWLLVRGRVEEAQKVVDRAARWNKVEPLPLQTLTTIMENLNQEV